MHLEPEVAGDDGNPADRGAEREDAELLGRQPARSGDGDDEERRLAGDVGRRPISHERSRFHGPVAQRIPCTSSTRRFSRGEMAFQRRKPRHVGRRAPRQRANVRRRSGASRFSAIVVVTPESDGFCVCDRYAPVVPCHPTAVARFLDIIAGILCPWSRRFSRARHPVWTWPARLPIAGRRPRPSLVSASVRSCSSRHSKRCSRSSVCPGQSLSTVEAALVAVLGAWTAALVAARALPAWRAPLTFPWLAVLVAMLRRRARGARVPGECAPHGRPNGAGLRSVFARGQRCVDDRTDARGAWRGGRRRRRGGDVWPCSNTQASTGCCGCCRLSAPGLRSSGPRSAPAGRSSTRRSRRCSSRSPSRSPSG